MGDKYIIELEDATFTNDRAKLYRVKGFNSLVFDETGLSKLKKYSSTDDKLDSIIYGLSYLRLGCEDKVTDDVKENPDAYTMKIRYHKELFPDLKEVEKNGNFIDLYTAEELVCKVGDYAEINLGISVEIPTGYWMQLVARSSSFKKYGIIQTNAFGVIDTTYCGDNDIVKIPVYCTRDVIIPANTRICQFRLVKDIDFCIEEVDKLDNPDRNGFGSTGEN